MKAKILFLLLILSSLLATPVLADCETAPQNLTATIIDPPSTPSGVAFEWTPNVPLNPNNKYMLILERVGVSAKKDTVISAMYSTFIEYKQLCNGPYMAYVRGICPEGSAQIGNEAFSDTIYFNVLSEDACFENLTACPEINLGGSVTGMVDGSMPVITVPCHESTFVIKPKFTVTGGTITGYTVQPTIYAPPIPFSEGTRINLVEDDKFADLINLPFRFCFYENWYQQALVAPNGYITFNVQYAGMFSPWSTAGYGPLPNAAIPDELKNSIYGVMEDVDIRFGGTAKWRLKSLREGCGILAISYDRIALYKKNTALQTYQTIIYQGSNIVDVFIKKRNRHSDHNAGMGVVGVTNSTGAVATIAQGRNIGDAWTAEREAWRFTPITTPPVYQITWYSGLGANQREIHVGDSLILTNSAKEEVIVAKLNITSCTGETLTFSDTVRTRFDLPTAYFADTICQRETYNKPPFAVKRYNFSGNFADTIIRPRAVTGGLCDSVLVLRLHVKKATLGEITDTVCPGDTVRFGLDGIAVSKNYHDGNTEYFADTLVNHLGCDSILILGLSNHAPAAMTLGILPQVCADNQSFLLNLSPSPGTTNPSAYKVDFDAKAEAAGFVDFDSTFQNGDYSVSINIPQGLYPDNYCADISVKDGANNCEGGKFNVCVPILYPDSIMQQKWNNIVGLKTKHYNGGYEIVSHQWYKNGAPVQGETGPYLKNVVLGDVISVEVTRPDGSKFMSCSKTIGPGKPEIYVNPYSMRGGTPIVISTKDDNNKLISIFSINGMVLHRVQANSPVTSVNAPPKAGTYLLEVITEKGARKVTRIVVKD